MSWKGKDVIIGRVAGVGSLLVATSRLSKGSSLLGRSQGLARMGLTNAFCSVVTRPDALDKGQSEALNKKSLDSGLDIQDKLGRAR